MVDLTGEMVITGCKVWTPGLSWAAPADELHLKDGRVVGIGREGAIRGERVSGQTERLPGGVLMPPFFDAHLHLDLGGKLLTRLSLTGCKSPEEALNTLHNAISSGDGWLSAIGLHENARPDPEEFHRATAGRPTLVMTRDYHSAYLNRDGIRELGVAASTELPEGGWLELDDAGDPNGILHENAVWWVEERLPKATDEEAAEEILTAQAHLINMGVLGVSDASDRPAWGVLRSLNEAGKLSLRVEHWHRCLTFDEETFKLSKQSSGSLLRQRLKTFLDGSLGSRSAWMLEDYSDALGERGKPVPELERYLKFLESSAEAGWSHAVHAIGDAAVRWASLHLPGIPAPAGMPHRLEHIQHIDIDSLKRIHHSPLIASLQPLHRTADLSMLAARLGAERTAYAYPQRSLMKGGGGVVFGTDWPVVGADPRKTLVAAITSRSPGEGMPGEELPLEQALEAMTVLPAEAAGFAGTGRLESGYNTDMIWLSEDPGVDASAWKDVAVGGAWRDGAPLIM